MKSKATILIACLSFLAAQGGSNGFAGPEFIYDGSPKSPAVTEAPEGASLTLVYDEPSAQPPSPVEEIHYNSIPTSLAPSYGSHSFAANNTMGLGDAIRLKSGSGSVSAVQVVMVNWARKDQWPIHALLNPAGYIHPITITAYRTLPSGSLESVTSWTEDILIPWRPDFSPDGSPYPFNGTAFIATIPFETPVQLPQEVFLLLSYNTSNTGFQPLITPGPYDSLNVALAATSPTIGTDQNSQAAFWVQPDLWGYPSPGVKPPMLRVISQVTPPRGSSTAPIDTGNYHLTATWTESGTQHSATLPFRILPAMAQIQFSGLKRFANGLPQYPQATTQPPGLSLDWSFNEGPTGPTAPGEHRITARIAERNFTGEASTTFILGIDKQQWLQPLLDQGKIDPSDTDDLDDPDQDGIVNLLEYAMGSPPDEATPPLQPLVAATPDHIRLRYRRNPLALDLTYEIEISSDLKGISSWEKVTPSTTSVTRDGDMETVDVSIPVGSGQSRCFARLKVKRQ